MNPTTWPILSTVIWLPIFGGILVLALGERRKNAAKWSALLVSIATMALCLPLFQDFDSVATGMQFVELSPWIETFNINYHLGIDGIALPLIMLTAFIGILVIIGAWDIIKVRISQYLAAFLILEGLMIGVFCALDAALFYIFFEAMLIPMFLIIGVWGGPNRVYATIKFFLYTFLGSVFMLVALVYLYLQGGSFAIADMHQLPLNMTEQKWLFFAFFAAFAVKIPMFPVHTWLPDAHVEAPTGGSVVLAAIMLKIGGYGFLRFNLPILPDASAELDWLMITLSLIAVVYVGLVALVQKDMKKLIAYSSISHMGFVTLGIFIAFAIFNNSDGDSARAALGVEGAMAQMVSHGFISAALFFCVGVLYDRMHSREIADYGGVINTMPWFGGFAVLFAMSNSGLPGTSGFVGEFMVILAAFQANFWFAFLAALTLILGAAYSLWMVKRVVFGDVANDRVAALKDINGREALILGSLAIAVLIVGVWPQPLLDMMHVSVSELLSHIQQSKI